AFNLQDHLDRVVKQERKDMTTESLYSDIDWDYIHELTALHWVRILVEFLPHLAFLRKQVEEIFHSERMTKRRLPPNRKTVVQPLGTNAERETETQGMMRAMLDFEAQMGLDEKAMEGLIITPRGDGASIAAMWRIKKYLSAHPSHYKAFRNRVPPGPEIWHTRWTQLNSISANCYGAASAQDPFALSKSATAVGAKRPSDLKKVDFWPISRSMTLFFEARVLDCWRIFFGVEDLLTDFPIPNSPLPQIETLLSNASTLVRRYASQDACHQALDRDFYDSSSLDMRVPLGTPWTRPIAEQTPSSELSNGDPGDVEIVDEAADAAGHLGEYIEPGEQPPEIAQSDVEEAPKKRKSKRKSKKTMDHVEAADFSGDRTLANECLFLQDMGWWIIAAHAVPEGEIGQLWEIMKVSIIKLVHPTFRLLIIRQIWIFCFSGSSNRNYATYLLETYCLHRYEASKDFSDAMFNNWLVNMSGKKYTECDYNQEDFNKWLEELVEHHGGDFDDRFYRHTLAPNVFHFLRFKEQIEEAFELKQRSKTHGAPHLRNEFQQLLRMHKEDELHLFRPHRTYGQAAINHLGTGYERLEDGRMKTFIEQSTAYSDIVIDVVRQSPTVTPEPPAAFSMQELEDMIRAGEEADEEDSDDDDPDESEIQGRAIAAESSDESEEEEEDDEIEIQTESEGEEYSTDEEEQ
ncbi:hypothetical protein R3P38DRAFT_2388527, partial [Favolaschia claudopus]